MSPPESGPGPGSHRCHKAAAGRPRKRDTFFLDVLDSLSILDASPPKNRASPEAATTVPLVAKFVEA